jgi:hypothetical protein
MGEERARDHEQLRLTLVEIAHEPHGQRGVALPLSNLRRGRVLTGDGKICATARAVNLAEALGCAADRADLMAQRRARAPGFSPTAEGTCQRKCIV